VIGYEVWIDRSYWASSGGERIERARWQAADGRLLDGQSVMEIQDVPHRLETSWTVTDDGIAVRSLSGDEDRSFHLPWDETPLADDRGLLVLIDLAAPWQLAAITLQPGTRGEAARFHPSTWRPATQDSGPVIERWTVTVAGREQVTTPAGSFYAWRVTFGTDRTIWYDVNDRPVPVRFFNGIETWSMQ